MLVSAGVVTASYAVTVAYVPWFADAASAPRWVLLSLLVPVFVRVREVRAAHLLGLLLIVWVALSGLWTPVPVEALQGIWRFVLLAGLFCIAFDMESLEDVFVGAGVGIACSSVVAIAQFAFDRDSAGLFLNKNFLAEAAVLVLIGLAVYRHWLLAALAWPAALLPMSRGALAALAAVGLLALWRHRMRLHAGVLLILLVGAALLVGVNGKSLGERYVIWSYTAAHLTWLGHGIGSFYIDFPSFGEFARRFDHAHNDFLEIAYELGAVGVVLFGVVLLGAMRNAGGGIRYVVAGFIVEGCFGFPLFLPVTGAIAAMCLGHLWGVRHRLRGDVRDGERALRARPRLVRVVGGRTLPARGGGLSA